MTQDTKNKFAEMLQAANNKANLPAKVKAIEKPINPPVKAKETVIDTQVNNTVELSGITFDDLIKTSPELPNKPKQNLTVINYSDKAIAVIGETYPIKDILKRIGGRFNYNLTCGAGWIFSKAKAELLRKELNLTFVL